MSTHTPIINTVDMEVADTDKVTAELEAKKIAEIKKKQKEQAEAWLKQATAAGENKPIQDFAARFLPQWKKGSIYQYDEAEELFGVDLELEPGCPHYNEEDMKDIPAKTLNPDRPKDEFSAGYGKRLPLES